MWDAPCEKLWIQLYQMSDTECELTVTHMHYTAWPDHGVPRNAMSVISFIRRVRKEHPAYLDKPLLVHCSAGVGRTGTFILLDCVMQQMKREGTLSVFKHFKNLRTQCMKMVQTQVSCHLIENRMPYRCFTYNTTHFIFLQTQYAFIHDALSELVVCGATDVSAADIRALSNEMSEIVERDGITGFQKQFQV